MPTVRRRRRPVRLIPRGPGRAARCGAPRCRAPRCRAPRCRASRCRATRRRATRYRAVRSRPGRCRAAQRCDARRRAGRSACPARAARPTYPGNPRLALGRRRHLLVGGPRHVPGSHRPRQRDPHACHASSVSRFPRTSPTCPTSRTGKPPPDSTRSRDGQKIRGHQGAGSQLMAVESLPTAPGRSSLTRPAAASAASRVPPR
jgi:hypothetical protein